ncbi:MAG: hypothetical protein HBSAPP04_01170 [Ignavibacteriaceae bacterium]|nr:MAG: hypothetical protein HBSAPP04_01170 [Ignavibacteriaceae bacterium]
MASKNLGRVIFFTTLFPDKNNPQFGYFNLMRARSIQTISEQLTVVVFYNLSIWRKYLMSSFDPIALYKTIIGMLKVPKKEIYEGIVVRRIFRLSLPYSISWKSDLKSLLIFNHRYIRNLLAEVDPSLVVTSWLHPIGTYFGKYYNDRDFKILAFIEGSDFLISAMKYDKMMQTSLSIGNCDRVITVSKALNHEVLKKLKLSNIITLPNFYDDSVFFYMEKCRKDEIFRILSVGGLNYVKGHDILLMALKEVKFKYELILVGEGPLMAEYTKFAKEHSINVCFVGTKSQKEIKELLSISDLFVMPSRSESFGIAAIEALATGTPVIAASTGGLRENILDGSNGFLFSVESVGELVKAIEKAASYNWDRKNISKQTYNKFSRERWQHNFLRIVKEIS